MQLSSSADLSKSLSDYTSLCSFTQTLQKPRWMVRFPLTLHPTRQGKHTQTKSLTLPNSLGKRSVDRTVGSRGPLKERAEKVLTRLEMDCAATTLQEGAKLRLEQHGITRLKRRLRSCHRHIELLSYSNQRAPYFTLLHRFHFAKVRLARRL